jgi:hypothetical protein
MLKFSEVYVLAASLKVGDIFAELRLQNRFGHSFLAQAFSAAIIVHTLSLLVAQYCHNTVDLPRSSDKRVSLSNSQ